MEDLANQVEIKYGCMGGGSTSNFFKVSSQIWLSNYHRVSLLFPECKGWHFPHDVELHGRQPRRVHGLQLGGHRASPGVRREVRLLHGERLHRVHHGEALRVGQGWQGAGCQGVRNRSVVFKHSLCRRSKFWQTSVPAFCPQW